MLSPKLFTEFLQDISKSFDQWQGISVDTLLIVYLLFADDLVLFSDSANGLQKQTALYKYTSLWHIIVSIPKTKVIIFNKRYTPECDNFYYADNVIEKAEKYKYLGVVYSTRYPKNVLKETFLHLASQAVKQFFLYTSNPVV